jgi:phosphoribosylaminoimidazolecarboxamide formyltransferase/IMP cyclohydrolase
MKTALLSVWDKQGLAALASRLVEKGWRLVASSGTARALQQVGLPVTAVEAITGETEMLDGRVKTLHPAIHAGLLARHTPQDQAALAARGWTAIDLLVVNLYPFETTISDPGCSLEFAIEQIDIGGVALLRAGAKNYQRVTVLCDPADYPEDLTLLSQLPYRQAMAARVFARTAAYDSAIAAYFARLQEKPEPVSLRLYPVQALRYGENPHQQACFLAENPQGTAMDGRLLQGKPLSYNNLLDLDSAWRAVHLFQEPAVVIVKHNSPCGIAVSAYVAAALEGAIDCDPLSAFGSVIASNREVDADFFTALGNLFVECIASPGFSEKALALLSGRTNLRLLQISGEPAQQPWEYRSIAGGFLCQEIDRGDPPGGLDGQVVSQRAPTAAEWEALQFAWKAVQPVKSNAIVLAKPAGNGWATVGIGGGQPNRVDCVEIAARRAADRARGAVLASDAFFPFPDGIQAAADFGVTAIIQPGGARRDAVVIAKANELGLAMVFTGVRHFRH